MIEEFKKEKNPTFEGEVNKAKEAKTWMVGMKKFFIVHNSYENMKEGVATLKLMKS